MRGHAAAARCARADQGIAVRADAQPQVREGRRVDHPNAGRQRPVQIQGLHGPGPGRRRESHRLVRAPARVQEQQRVQGQMETDQLSQRTGQRECDERLSAASVYSLFAIIILNTI